MKKIRWVHFVVAFFFINVSLQAGIDIFGYFENRFFLTVDPEIEWGDPGEKFSLGDYNRVRLKLRASPSEKVNVNLALDFYTFFGFITSPLGTYSPEDSGGEESMRIDLDRAYVDLYFKHFDLTIGKQRIALGVSYLWAPLDIFNRINILEPKEEKPGANAAKVYVPLGTASSLLGVFSPDEDLKTSKVALRGKTQVGGVDMAITFIYSGFTDTTVLGLDIRGETLIGWWIEAGYFKLSDQSAAKLVVGFDYTFPLKNGLYWLNEFFYDASGAENKDQYDHELLLAGERFTLGRYYLFSMLRYGFSQLFSVSLAYIGNLGDGSYILNPALQYVVRQNVTLSGGVYFPLGQSGGEFNTVVPAEESNRISPVFFIWLKINF